MSELKRSISVETSKLLRELIVRQARFLTAQPHTYETLVVAALALRATRLNAGLLTLHASGFGDEAINLARTLIEVVINCGYLMITGEKEFKAFVAFPVAMLGKQHRAYIAHTQDQSNFSKEFNQLVETAAFEAIPVSGRTLKDSSWTSESVYKRAVAVDAVFQDGIFGDLATTVYADAHDYVHGNFSAILSTMDTLLKGSSERTNQEGDESLLHAAALCLLGCALSLNKHFKMHFNDEIQMVIRQFASC